MWVTKLLISPVKKIWPKIGIFGQFGPCRLIQCPVGGSVGGCGARAVSRKTPIYFIKFDIVTSSFMLGKRPKTK